MKVHPLTHRSQPDPWAIVMVSTCCRKSGHHYLPKTLIALEKAGARNAWQRVILSDGKPPADCTWTTIPNWNGPTGGCFENLWRAFRIAAEAGAERLIYFEDDVLPCVNALDHLLRLEIPSNLAFIDLCDLKEVLPGSPPGIYQVSLSNRESPYHGTQGMMFPRRTFEYLTMSTSDPKSLSDVQHHVDVEAGRTPEKMCDIVLGAALALSPWPSYGSHIPCMVQHTGDISSIYETEKLRMGRVATNFPGADFDALSLATAPALPR